MSRPGISQHCSDHFWLCRSLFVLDCKFFSHTHTHTSGPHIMLLDVSTQESVLWTGLICVCLPLGLVPWFKAMLSSFVFLFFSPLCLCSSPFSFFFHATHIIQPTIFWTSSLLLFLCSLPQKLLWIVLYKFTPLFLSPVSFIQFNHIPHSFFLFFLYPSPTLLVPL